MDKLKLSAPIANLDVSHNMDWDFDVTWWEQDNITPINFLSVIGTIHDRVDILLDLEPYFDISENLIQVRIPMSAANTVPVGEHSWFMTATSERGDVRGLLRGKVMVRS